MADEAKKEEGGGEAGAEEGGKKKLPLWVIILIASQVLIVAAAIVVFKMMSSKSAEEAEHTAEPTESQQKVEPEHAKPDSKVISGPQFPLEAFIVNLIDDGRGPRYLKIEVKFELESEDVGTEIENRLAQIRDELLILLSSKRQTDIETTDGKRILKDEIFTRVNKILVTGRVKRVYFTDFVIQ